MALVHIFLIILQLLLMAATRVDVVVIVAVAQLLDGISTRHFKYRSILFDTS